MGSNNRFAMRIECYIWITYPRAWYTVGLQQNVIVVSINNNQMVESYLPVPMQVSWCAEHFSLVMWCSFEWRQNRGVHELDSCQRFFHLELYLGEVFLLSSLIHKKSLQYNPSQEGHLSLSMAVSCSGSSLISVFPLTCFDSWQNNLRVFVFPLWKEKKTKKRREKDRRKGKNCNSQCVLKVDYT